MTFSIEEPDHQQAPEQFLPEHLVRRLKLLFVVSCGLGMAAVSGWAGFAYKTSSTSRVSDQIASLVKERDSMKAQRDAALRQLEQVQRPPQAQIAARLNALGAEYNRLWQLAKTKKPLPVKEVDSTSIGTVRKASSSKQAH